MRGEARRIVVVYSFFLFILGICSYGSNLKPVDDYRLRQRNGQGKERRL